MFIQDIRIFSVKATSVSGKVLGTKFLENPIFYYLSDSMRLKSWERIPNSRKNLGDDIFELILKFVFLFTTWKFRGSYMVGRDCPGKSLFQCYVNGSPLCLKISLSLF